MRSTLQWPPWLRAWPPRRWRGLPPSCRSLPSQRRWCLESAPLSAQRVARGLCVRLQVATGDSLHRILTSPKCSYDRLDHISGDVYLAYMATLRCTRCGQDREKMAFQPFQNDLGKRAYEE